MLYPVKLDAALILTPYPCPQSDGGSVRKGARLRGEADVGETWRGR